MFLAKLIPIVITILRFDNRFLFLQRRNPPYENLWGLVGGKVEVGEHIPKAALREVMEETGASNPEAYFLKGIVSERLLSKDGDLLAHFLLFVGDATVDSFEENHREGTLALFTAEQIVRMKEQVVPSDFEIFARMGNTSKGPLVYHEAELIQEGSHYSLGYYREDST